MLSDPYLLFTKAIGAEVDRNSKGLGIRSNRYLMIIENFIVVNIHVEKETKECGLTSAESLFGKIKLTTDAEINGINSFKDWENFMNLINNLAKTYQYRYR